MTIEEIEEIFSEKDAEWDGDNAMKGLLILSKYIDINKKEILQGANHNVIYGPDLEDLIEAGITREDIEELAMLNWMVEDSTYLTCFV